MLEIVALIFILQHIGKIAERKGLKTLKWKIYTVAAWIGFELVGFMVGLFFFEPTDYVSLMLIGVIFAFTGYVLVKKKLESMPDSNIDRDIDNIGR